MNRKTLDAQHRCARAFHRRVTGSQTRLAITRPATPVITLCSDTRSSLIAPAHTAASVAVPASASTNLRTAGHAPVARARRLARTNKLAVPSGAATMAASSSAASIYRPPAVMAGQVTRDAAAKHAAMITCAPGLGPWPGAQGAGEPLPRGAAGGQDQ